MQGGRELRTVGFTLTCLFLQYHFFSLVQYQTLALIRTFFHWPSLCITVLALVAAAAKCGFPEVRAALSDVFSKETADHARMMKNQRVFVTMAKIVWAISLLGAALNYLLYNKTFIVAPGEFLASLRYTLHPLIYGIIVSNLILLNLATYLERKKLVMPESLNKRLLQQK